MRLFRAVAAALAGFGIVAVVAVSPTWAQEKPNIVLIFMDNFGWGEIGAYGGGILRGAPTPQIDSLRARPRFPLAPAFTALPSGR